MSTEFDCRGCNFIFPVAEFSDLDSSDWPPKATASHSATAGKGFDRQANAASPICFCGEQVTDVS